MKINIIDGPHLCHRAYHVFNTFTNSKGEFTGMAYGFFSILQSYYSQFGGVFIVTWEGKNNWRKTFYPEYKAHRKDNFSEAQSKEFYSAMDRVKRLIDLCGILQLKKEGFEADDTISFLSRAIGQDINIITGDKDLLQLIDDEKNVHVIKPGKDGLTFFNEEAVCKKYDIDKFSLFVDYLAIIGDKSDNIKGIKGFGPKKTSKVLRLKDPMLELDILNPGNSETVSINKKLINLLNNETWIKKIEKEDIYFGNADLIGLNSEIQDMEIRAFSSKTLIENFYKPEIYTNLGKLLLDYKSIF